MNPFVTATLISYNLDSLDKLIDYEDTETPEEVLKDWMQQLNQLQYKINYIRFNRNNGGKENE